MLAKNDSGTQMLLVNTNTNIRIKLVQIKTLNPRDCIEDFKMSFTFKEEMPE